MKEGNHFSGGEEKSVRSQVRFFLFFIPACLDRDDYKAEEETAVRRLSWEINETCSQRRRVSRSPDNIEINLAGNEIRIPNDLSHPPATLG